MIRRYIVTCNGRVPLRQYIDGVKYAKAHPDQVFTHGLTGWWSCTGADIMRQFMSGLHDRINQAVPYNQRGMGGA